MTSNGIHIPTYWIVIQDNIFCMFIFALMRDSVLFWHLSCCSHDVAVTNLRTKFMGIISTSYSVYRVQCVWYYKFSPASLFPLIIGLEWPGNILMFHVHKTDHISWNTSVQRTWSSVGLAPGESEEWLRHLRFSLPCSWSLGHYEECCTSFFDGLSYKKATILVAYPGI